MSVSRHVFLEVCTTEGFYQGNQYEEHTTDCWTIRSEIVAKVLNSQRVDILWQL